MEGGDFLRRKCTVVDADVVDGAVEKSFAVAIANVVMKSLSDYNGL